MNYIVQSALEERRQHFVSKRSVWNQLTTTAFFIVANLIQFSSFAGQKWPKTAWTQGKSKCVELQGLYQRPAVTRSRKTGSVIFIFKHSTATESRNNLGRCLYGLWQTDMSGFYPCSQLTRSCAATSVQCQAWVSILCLLGLLPQLGAEPRLNSFSWCKCKGSLPASAQSMGQTNLCLLAKENVVRPSDFRWYMPTANYLGTQ